MSKKLFIALIAVAFIGECLCEFQDASHVLMADFGISAIISAVMAAVALTVGVGTSIGSGVKKAHANKALDQKQAILDEQRATRKAFYNRELNKDITTAADTANIIRQNNENQRIADARTDAMGLTLGSTAERIDAGHEANRKRFSDSLADMAAAWGERKYQMKQDLMNGEDDYYKGRLGLKDEKYKMEKETSDMLAKASINAFESSAKMAGDAANDYFGVPSSGDKKIG